VEPCRDSIAPTMTWPTVTALGPVTLTRAWYYRAVLPRGLHVTRQLPAKLSHTRRLALRGHGRGREIAGRDRRVGG